MIVMLRGGPHNGHYVTLPHGQQQIKLPTDDGDLAVYEQAGDAEQTGFRAMPLQATFTYRRMEDVPEQEEAPAVEGGPQESDR